jgi:5-bromo-4-chloroindolyl phosphate hydrolysis protein
MQVSWKINMLITAGVTVLAFLAADRFLDLRLWVDTLIALVFGGIVNQFFLHDRKEDSEVEVVPGLTRKELNLLLASGQDWTAKFSRLAQELQKGHRKTAGEIQEIADMVAALFRNFETDPKDLLTPGARRLVNDHLPRAHRFVDAYARLAVSGRLTQGESVKLAAMESKIATIRESLVKHLEGFRNSDFDALKIEGETLETIYRLDI